MHRVAGQQVDDRDQAHWKTSDRAAEIAENTFG
jgi:hypothetical protein